MKCCRLLMMLWLVILPNLHLYAGEATVDLGISVSVMPSGVLLPGSEGVVNISITNYGPDTGSAAFVMGRTSDGMGVSYPPLNFVGLLDGPCTGSPIFDPPPGDIFSFWIVHDLAPDETAVCSFSFVVTETSVTEQLARWEVMAGAGGQHDPNPVNDVAEVMLRFAPQVAPLPVPALSWPGLLLLLILITFISVRTVLRSHAGI